MNSNNNEVRSLAEKCIVLLQSAAPPFEEDVLSSTMQALIQLLSVGPTGRTSTGGQTSPRASVRLREGSSRKPGGVQSKSVALPVPSAKESFSVVSGVRTSSPGGQLSPPTSPATKQRSGSVWSAAQSPQIERRASASATPTLGRHKTSQPETPPVFARSPSEQVEKDALVKSESAKLYLQRAKETENLGKEGILCSSCNLRTMSRPCSECWEGQCVDVVCAGLYTLKSLGESQKRLICKRCIEKLKQIAVASRSETADGKARLPIASKSPDPIMSNKTEQDDGADNPMFLAAKMRRNRRRGDEEEEERRAEASVGQPEDQDDPFDDFSWTGASDESQEKDD
jgi:hypothetical protein